MRRVVLGVDFGTLSARSIFVDPENGAILSEASFAYTHGVMDQVLECSSKKMELPQEFALQCAQDYIEALEQSVKAAKLKLEDPIDVLALGIAFTASSPLPLQNGIPLSEFFPDEPHAYVKLWKHHAAAPQAKRMSNSLPKEFVNRFGSQISCEWTLPKLLEFLESSPLLANRTTHWVEAGDYITNLLVGKQKSPTRSECQAGYKAFWNAEEGYAKKEDLEKIRPGFSREIEKYFSGSVVSLGKSIGTLTQEWAEKLGLSTSVLVASSVIDAHAGVPGSGICKAGELISIMGTSTCHMGLHEKRRWIPGIESAVQNGIVPGLVGYEAGQPAVGDSFEWWRKISGKSFEELELEAKGSRCDLISTDWFNGIRSPHQNTSARAVISGLSLQTNAGQVYRSIVEATAFTTRRIRDLFLDYGIEFKRLVLSGGIATKSNFVCQIYANILEQEIEIAHASQPIALGAAIYAAVAAFDDLATKNGFENRVKKMTSSVRFEKVKPQDAARSKAIYEKYLNLEAQSLKNYQ